MLYNQEYLLTEVGKDQNGVPIYYNDMVQYDNKLFTVDLIGDGTAILLNDEMLVLLATVPENELQLFKHFV